LQHCNEISNTKDSFNLQTLFTYIFFLCRGYGIYGLWFKIYLRILFTDEFARTCNKSGRFGDTKGVMGNCKSTDIQYNGQKKNDKSLWANNGKQVHYVQL
jgi:hypothetical protein